MIEAITDKLKIRYKESDDNIKKALAEKKEAGTKDYSQVYLSYPKNKIKDATTTIDAAYPKGLVDYYFGLKV
jgi:hypothetical protein